MITYPIESEHSGMQKKAIELNAVSKKYPFIKISGKDINNNFDDLWALGDISFDVYKGDMLGIVGRNGAGKTTLLNIIVGVLSPTQGRRIVSGKVLGLFNLGVGFQDELTGKENIYLNGAIMGATRKEVEDKLDFIIEFSELGDFIDMPLGTYSQGMRLRLGFSIIVNLDFDILVIDEVLAVGDSLFQSKCFERFMDFRRLGKTLVITSQSLDLIERLCDKVVLLDHGRVLFCGGVSEGINKYHALLNTEKFFVGPAHAEVCLVENTKKWAEDTSGWGKELGTKEAVIEKVELINKFGLRCSSVKSREPLKVKVYFRVRDTIKELHFGVAIFRRDGVYCYGPNTEFDGYKIMELKPGKGYFSLKFHKVLLASGEYRLSVVIWDKSETLAFSYHDGYYKLNVTGNCNCAGELLNMPFVPSPKSFFDFRKEKRNSPDLSALNDKWGMKIEAQGIRLEPVRLLNRLNEGREVFMTGEQVKLLINFTEIRARNRECYLWLGIYRDDGIYCQGLTRALKRSKNFNIVFSELPLLPGGYRISAGIWDDSVHEFLMCHHGIYPLRMVFNRQDHGTVYLKHKWQWGVNI